MLQEVIDLQKNAVKNLFSKLHEDKKELTFRAPTGSGKTFMMADLMNQVFEERDDVVFLVSALSKGNLAKQNYDKFCEYRDSGKFPQINPYLINTDVSGEQGLEIEMGHNVYILPEALNKQNGRLSQGALNEFIRQLTYPINQLGDEKKIYVIKDESHIARNNLDVIGENIFSKIINFSATPNLRRGQYPDVKITDLEAVKAKLIKDVKPMTENYDLTEEEFRVEFNGAVDKYLEIKKDYVKSLGVHPCLIVQISNKNKAEQELKVIHSVLEEREADLLQWAQIMDADKEHGYQTNSPQLQQISKKRWKDELKRNLNEVNIIIFKMVISEGWDIPRACMLYQVRDTDSKQLAEQVIGRVRRNPRLLDFETLDEDAKKLATTAWVWAKAKENVEKTLSVKLYDEPTDITSNLKLKTTRIKPLTNKKDFNLEKFLTHQQNQDIFKEGKNIFELYHKFDKTDNSIKQLCYDYCGDSFEKWFKFNSNLEAVVNESQQYNCDYDESMEVVTDENGKEVEISFPVESIYVDNEHYVNISNWVWKRRDGNNKFSFDSEAEQKWAEVLKTISTFVSKKVEVGKKNKKAGTIYFDETIEPNKKNVEEKYLWGKNYVTNSALKFEYYLDGIHASYPDFVMKDKYDRIHIFEVKSLNSSPNGNINEEEYRRKMQALIESYQKASELTEYYFYVADLDGNDWKITQIFDGEINSLSEDNFKNFLASEK